MADGIFSTLHNDLAAPFPDSAISWRIGSTTKQKKEDDPIRGMALAYIDARDVMERLDSVVGAENWSDQYVETEKGRVICTLSVRINGEWVAKSDGAGDSDVESEKGAISDALKRAAVKWGIGRYLYNIDSPWIECEKRGQSTVMKPNERKKLDKCHHDYVRNNFTNPNAGSSDAGQREQPKTQLATGAEDRPPVSAPVQTTPTQTLGKVDARPDFGLMVEEMRRITSTKDLKDWGKLNAKRVQLQPKDWQGEIRKQYVDLMDGLEHQERASAEANEEFADAR